MTGSLAGVADLAGARRQAKKAMTPWDRLKLRASKVKNAKKRQRLMAQADMLKAAAAAGASPQVIDATSAALDAQLDIAGAPSDATLIGDTGGVMVDDNAPIAVPPPAGANPTTVAVGVVGAVLVVGALLYFATGRRAPAAAAAAA